MASAATLQPLAEIPRKEEPRKTILNSVELNLLPANLKPVFMEDAMSISKQARLIVRAISPHVVMHANKEWNCLTGYSCRKVRDGTLASILAKVVEPQEGQEHIVQHFLKDVVSRGHGDITCVIRRRHDPVDARLRAIAVVRPAEKLKMNSLKILAYLITVEPLGEADLNSDSSFGDSGLSSSHTQLCVPKPRHPDNCPADTHSESSDSSLPAMLDLEEELRQKRAAIAMSLESSDIPTHGSGRSRRGKRKRTQADGSDLHRQMEGYRTLHKELSSYYEEAGGYFDARQMPYANLENVPGAQTLSECGIIAVNTRETTCRPEDSQGGFLEPWIVASTVPPEQRPAPAALGEYRPPSCMTISTLMSRVANIYAALERDRHKLENQRGPCNNPMKPDKTKAPPVDEYLLAAWQGRREYLQGLGREESSATENTSEEDRSSGASTGSAQDHVPNSEEKTSMFSDLDTDTVDDEHWNGGMFGDRESGGGTSDSATSA